jgi:hypothetical protein
MWFCENDPAAAGKALQASGLFEVIDQQVVHKRRKKKKVTSKGTPGEKAAPEGITLDLQAQELGLPPPPTLPDDPGYDYVIIARKKPIG